MDHLVALLRLMAHRLFSLLLPLSGAVTVGVRSIIQAQEALEVREEAVVTRLAPGQQELQAKEMLAELEPHHLILVEAEAEEQVLSVATQLLDHQM